MENEAFELTGDGLTASNGYSKSSFGLAGVLGWVGSHAPPCPTCDGVLEGSCDGVLEGSCDGVLDGSCSGVLDGSWLGV